MFINYVRLGLNALSSPTFQLALIYELCSPFSVVTLLSLLVWAYWAQTICFFWCLISGLEPLYKEAVGRSVDSNFCIEPFFGVRGFVRRSILCEC